MYVSIFLADLPFQLHLSKFEQNNQCGYILKPLCMRRGDKDFDPFVESPMENIVAASLQVKVHLQIESHLFFEFFLSLRLYPGRCSAIASAASTSNLICTGCQRIRWDVDSRRKSSLATRWIPYGTKSRLISKRFEFFFLRSALALLWILRLCFPNWLWFDLVSMTMEIVVWGNGFYPWRHLCQVEIKN